MIKKMMKKQVTGLMIALGFLGIQVQGQDTNAVAYPKGIYETFEAYQKHEPTDTQTIFTAKMAKDSIKYRFYNTATEKRLRKAFAFSDGEHVYVSGKYIYKHLNPKDTGKQMRDDGNYHIKAKKIGTHYHYYENYFTGAGAVIWGGAIAAAAARRIKGVVYDITKSEFNIFRNAKDFKRFVSQNHENYLKDHPEVAAKKGEEDIEMIRSFIGKVY